MSLSMARPMASAIRPPRPARSSRVQRTRRRGRIAAGSGGRLGEGVGLRREHRRRADAGHIVGRDGADVVEAEGRRPALRGLMPAGLRSGIRARGRGGYGAATASGPRPSARASAGGSGRSGARPRSRAGLERPIPDPPAGRRETWRFRCCRRRRRRRRVSPGKRRADDRRQALAAVRHGALARRPDRGEREHVDRRAGELGALRRRAATSRARIASSRSWSPWWRWSALVAAKRMRSIRRVTRPLSQSGPAEPEGGEDVGERRLRGRRRPSGPALSASSASTSTIWRSRRAKCSRKNGRTTAALIGLVAPRHHRGERAVRDRAIAEVERREGQRRRAVEVAGHQEAARAAWSRGWFRRRGWRGDSR